MCIEVSEVKCSYYVKPNKVRRSQLKTGRLWCGSEAYELVVKWSEWKVIMNCKCNST
jgi:hypothetical protein